MKDKRRTWEIFSFYDRSGLEKRLMQMAEKGWLVERIGSFLWTYRRIEPQKLTFCVCWFPRASVFDPEPSEEQQTFYDFCRHTGWTPVATSGQMQVFYNEAADPVPIETDPVMEIDAIHRTAKRTTLPSHLILLLMSLINGGLFFSRLRSDPIGVLASTANLFTGMCWVVLFLLEAVECGSYALWHRRAVKAAERGEFLQTKGHRRFQLISLAVVGLGLIYYFASVLTSGNRMMATVALLMFGVYLPGVYLLVYGVKALLKKKKVSAGINRAATIASAFAVSFLLISGITWGVLYGSANGWFAGTDEETYTYRGGTFTARRDALPLTVEDLLGASGDTYSKDNYSEDIYGGGSYSGDIYSNDIYNNGTYSNDTCNADTYGGGGYNNADYSFEQQTEESIFLAQYGIVQRPRFDAEEFKEMPRLEYTITKVKVPALYKLCKDALLADWNDDWRPEGQKDYAVPIDPALWGVKDAYQLANQEYGPENRFLLCYEDMFAEIRFDWEPTPEQMALAAEKIRDGWGRS